jgi:ABC-2 type transport system ATP-binding protein
MSYAIQTRGLSKVFSDLVAVDGVDIQVKEGVIHGFIGPNGAGKSTTMKMLIGALHPTQGSGSIKGHPIGWLRIHQGTPDRLDGGPGTHGLLPRTPEVLH